MLAVGHPLLDQEEHEAGRHERHGEDHTDGHKHVHSAVVTAGSRKKNTHSEFAAAAAAINADGSDAGGGNSELHKNLQRQRTDVWRYGVPLQRSNQLWGAPSAE